MENTITYLDDQGEGMPYVLDPVTGKSLSVYNGSVPCGSCGSLLNPVQSLSSTLCQPCGRKKAAKSVANRMA
jgi:hypothetical protein